MIAWGYEPSVRILKQFENAEYQARINPTRLLSSDHSRTSYNYFLPVIPFFNSSTLHK